jgi:hypothetical protein
MAIPGAQDHLRKSPNLSLSLSSRHSHKPIDSSLFSLTNNYTLFATTSSTSATTTRSRRVIGVSRARVVVFAPIVVAVVVATVRVGICRVRPKFVRTHAKQETLRDA